MTINGNGYGDGDRNRCRCRCRCRGCGRPLRPVMDARALAMNNHRMGGCRGGGHAFGGEHSDCALNERTRWKSARANGLVQTDRISALPLSVGRCAVLLLIEEIRLAFVKSEQSSEAHLCANRRRTRAAAAAAAEMMIFRRTSAEVQLSLLRKNTKPQKQSQL
jgi:hypothetical protein